MRQMTRTTLLAALAALVLLSFAAEASASCEHDDRECQEWFATLPSWFPHMGYASPEEAVPPSRAEQLCEAAVGIYGHKLRAVHGRYGDGWAASDNSFEAWLTRPIAMVTCKAIAVEAERQGFDPLIAVAIAAQESHFDPAALGEGRERGPLQPQEYHCGDDEYCEDVEEAIESGIRYLVHLRGRAQRYGQQKLIGAYHCGWAGVGGDTPGVPYRCYTYVERVTARIAAIRERAA